MQQPESVEGTRQITEIQIQLPRNGIQRLLLTHVIQPQNLQPGLNDRCDEALFMPAKKRLRLDLSTSTGELFFYDNSRVQTLGERALLNSGLHILRLSNRLFERGVLGGRSGSRP